MEIEAVQKMTTKQLQALRESQTGIATSSRNRKRLLQQCVSALMPRTNGTPTAAPSTGNGICTVTASDEQAPAPVAKQRKPRTAKQPPQKHTDGGRRTVGVGKRKAPRKAPAKRAARQEHTPESVGIGKVMRHGMRTDPYAGHTAECTAKADGFHVAMVGPKGGRKDLGVYASLGAAAKATGQNANGATFWRIAPYPKHAAK